MTGWKLFTIGWHFESSVVLGSTVLTAWYLYKVRGNINLKTVSFIAGILIILLALTSPVDRLGEDYLFSLHMVQHMLLGVIAPLLMVAGLPQAITNPWLKFPIIGSIEKLIGTPTIALIVASGTFWLWHLPALYNLTLQNESIHVFEHITLIATGVILWWPVLKPDTTKQLAPMASVIYLSIAALLSTILGMIFTVSDTVYYAGYAHPSDDLGALDLIRNKWGLDQLADQKLGGAIMWEPAGVIFLAIMMVKMKTWFEGDSEHQIASTEKSSENATTI